MIFNDNGLAVFSAKETELLKEALYAVLSHGDTEPIHAAEYRVLLGQLTNHTKVIEDERKIDQLMSCFFNNVDIELHSAPCFSPEEFPATQFSDIAEQVMQGFIGHQLTSYCAHTIRDELVHQFKGFMQMHGISLRMDDGTSRRIRITVSVRSLRKRYVVDVWESSKGSTLHENNYHEAM